MTTPSRPLPKQTAANDKLISSTPYAQLTRRQKDYADLYGVRLQADSNFGQQGNRPYLDPKDTGVNRPAPQAVTTTNDDVLRALATAGDQQSADEIVRRGGQAPAVPSGGFQQDLYKPPGAAQSDDPVARANAEAKDRANRDAFARLQAILDDYGLGSLSGVIRGWLQDGLSESEIAQRMRETPEFKQRFPAIEERKKRGMSPLSPAEYLAYEKQARQLFRSAGLPQGFYDGNDDFTKFLSADVSLSELGDRVGLASNAAFNSDSSVLTALASFGITGGDLTAFFLDPDVAQPLLERKYNAARISATGNRAGFGFLTEAESTDLLQTGVNEGAAAQGLSDLASRKELFGAMDRGEDQIGRGEQLDATFKGNANARRRIENRQRRRQAVFEQGGSFAQGQNGVSGLGSAQT